MKIKTITIEGKTYAVLDEKGMPVYTYDDGREVGFDAPASVNKIKELNGEAKTHRENKEAAEAKLRSYDGIEDAEAARAAVETVKNLEAGELVKAGKVEEIKAAARKAADEQVAEARKGLTEKVASLEQQNADLRSGWDGERIGTSFANSKFATEKLAVPGAVAQKIFGESFKVEDGKIVGYHNGAKIYSRENPGDPASFDEALGVLVDAYPFRESLVRGSGGGSGGGGRGGAELGGKELSRAQFEQMNQAERGVKMREGYTVVD